MSTGLRSTTGGFVWWFVTGLFSIRALASIPFLLKPDQLTDKH